MEDKRLYEPQLVNWWEAFKTENKDNNELRDVFALLHRADDTGKEEDLDRAIEAIAGLNDKEYELEKESFDKRVKILQTRLERKISEDFPAMVKTLRKNKGYSLARLSEETGISASYINRIELGDRKSPSLPVIKKLSVALGFPVNSSLRVAGLSEDDEAATITQILYANSFKLNSDGETLHIEDKEKMIKLVRFILDMEWGESKHLDSLELFGLIDDIKEVQSKNKKS